MGSTESPGAPASVHLAVLEDVMAILIIHDAECHPLQNHQTQEYFIFLHLLFWHPWHRVLGKCFHLFAFQVALAALRPAASNAHWQCSAVVLALHTRSWWGGVGLDLPLIQKQQHGATLSLP